MSNPPDRIVDAIDVCGEPTGETETREIQYRQGDETGTTEKEMAVRCEGEITADDYVGMRYAHEEGYEGKVHVFKCPECSAFRHVCPTCTGESGAPGWFRGESTGEMLACPACNYEEVVRQRRDPYR